MDLFLRRGSDAGDTAREVAAKGLGLLSKVSAAVLLGKDRLSRVWLLSSGVEVTEVSAVSKFAGSAIRVGIGGAITGGVAQLASDLLGDEGYSGTQLATRAGLSAAAAGGSAALGAAVGTAIGGPVGAAIGFGVGVGVNWVAHGGAMKISDEVSSAIEDVAGRVSDFFDF